MALREDVIALSEAYKRLDMCRFALERIRAACKAEAWLDTIVEKHRPMEEIKCRHCHHLLFERDESGECAKLVFFPDAQGVQCSRCCFPSALKDAGVLVMDPFPILSRLRALDQGLTSRPHVWVSALVFTVTRYLIDIFARPDSGKTVLIHPPTELSALKAALTHHGLSFSSLTSFTDLYPAMKFLIAAARAQDAARVALIQSDMDLKSLARVRIPNVTHILVLCEITVEFLTAAVGVTLRPPGEIQRDVTIVSLESVVARPVDFDFSALPLREWE
ncbi:hypothetical protein BCR44DRAFT_1038846 [Catenaria anguillulae PL171]|uniref:Uncharacterized protein n=1 Tax=Catenaria anguillulae PL171 TaxID=765915 RepID=A0A1Y2H5J3_9FUNG|nr:hypothetical protein BCR44DRAFT_1038846 [Catenaria anguillulae PL171]